MTAEEQSIPEANEAGPSSHAGVADATAHVAPQTNVSHEPTLYAEPIFHVGPLPVTNSLINSWGAVFIIMGFSLAIRRNVRQVPRGLQNAFEIILEGALNMTDTVTGNRAKSRRILPFVFGAFIFILINNWLGLLPGIGSIGFMERAQGHEVFIPLFRGGTADLNTTLALALIAVVGANVFGIVSVGLWGHLNKFVNAKAIWEIPGKVLKDPTVLIVNPIKFFVGIIEIIGEMAKIASLSFRLFGNIFAGEVLLSSMAVIFAFVLPVPFMFFEITVGIIQAFIFSMLMLVYFTIASTVEEH